MMLKLWTLMLNIMAFGIALNRADVLKSARCAGVVTVRIRNVKYPEVLYAADKNPVTLDGHRVLSKPIHEPRLIQPDFNQTVNRGAAGDDLWRMIHVTDSVVRFQSVKHPAEYLYAADDDWNFANCRRRVLTGSLAHVNRINRHAEWVIHQISPKSNRYGIKNRLYGEELYAAAIDACSRESGPKASKGNAVQKRRYPFTWCVENDQEWQLDNEKGKNEWAFDVQSESL